MEGSAGRFAAALECLNAFASQTRGVLSTFDDSGARSLVDVSRDEIEGLDGYLFELQNELLQLSSKLERYSDRPRKAK